MKTLDNKVKKGRKRWLFAGALLLLLFAGGCLWQRQSAEKEAAALSKADAQNIGVVRRGSIQNELTASGSLSAKNAYTITSLVEGEILEANFEEGDQVEAGEVLYRIDPTDLNAELETAKEDLKHAEEELADAKTDYEEAKSIYESGVYRAKKSGYVKELQLMEGDSAGGNTQNGFATLYNDRAMELRVPFLEAEADAIPIGADVIVNLSDTGEQIPGKVTKKAELVETLPGGVLVKQLCITVYNPGGLRTEDTALVQYGDMVSAEEGSFTPALSEPLKAELPKEVKVASVLVQEGQYVEAGTPLFTMTKDSVSDALKSYENTYRQAEKSLSQAETKMTQLTEELSEYTITAPISGQVIEKTAKAGDKIDRQSGSTTNSLAIIYDLSALTFEMSIDELDISKVKEGQRVEIQADAFPDMSFEGYVSNVSLNGSYANGVTTYPVTVTLNEKGDLLPGMNVDGTILLEQAEDVLYIPSGALQRGDVVYVKDSSLSGGSGQGETERQAADQKKPEAEQVLPEAESGKPEEKAERKPAGTTDGKPAGTTDGGMMPGMSKAPEGFTAVKVETGLVTDDAVEIRSGLSEGQEVYVDNSAGGGESFMSFTMSAPGMVIPMGGGPRG